MARSPLPVIALTILLAVAAPARAQQIPSDARLDSAVFVAVDFWAERGVTGCPGGIVAHGWRKLSVAGHSSQCHIWINAVIQKAANNGPWWLRIMDATTECALVVHEVGHSLGIEHTNGGLMDPVYWAHSPPYDCRRWARNMYSGLRPTSRTSRRN